jgi:hypothetical protein
MRPGPVPPFCTSTGADDEDLAAAQLGTDQPSRLVRAQRELALQL